MKKSTRILAILMAFVMLLGSFSVMGSAYEAYKGNNIKDQYNDVDAVEFTLEQSASMALDEIDRMLAKEQLVLDVFIGTLDLGSVNTTLTSVLGLVKSVETLLPLLGDASALPSFVTPLEGVQRFEDSDLDVVYALLNFISKISPLAEKYVNGTVNLGILDSFIASFKFDVRNLAIGLVYGMTKAGKEADYDAFDDGGKNLPEKYKNTTNGAITLLQDLLNELVLGSWQKLDEEFDDPYSVVMYESYSFKTEDGKTETAPNTAKYDYYGWVHPTDWVTVGLGGSVRVTEGAEAPAPIYDIVDITTDKTGYEFIEALMQAAYNRILVPVLNRDTRVWLRELCGVEYDETKTRRTVFDEATGEWVPNPDYDPTYDGDYVYDPENVFDTFLNRDAYVQTVTIPTNETFVDNFNNTLGDFLQNVLKVPMGEKTAEGYSWTWQYGVVDPETERNNGNALLFTNICSVARFVLKLSGNLFFSDMVDVPTPEEIDAMNNQQMVAFIIRAILNSSVDWMYIEDEYQSIAEVGYRAVEQLAWQDIPQYTYTKPVRSGYPTVEAYYDAVVEKALTILFDVAIYNLNQGFDMVPAGGSDAADPKKNGLLQYSGDTGSYEDKLIQIVAWAVTTYGPVLNIKTDDGNADNNGFFCDNAKGATTGLTINDVWNDIDSILNAIIPIKGEGAWISGEIAGDGSTIVSKTLIFDYLLKPIYYLNATNLAEIFGRNENGQFAEDNGVEIIMTLLTNIFELLFPGVFKAQETIDQVLNNELLGAMVGDLIKVLGTNDTTNAAGTFLEAQGDELAEVALPLVCMLLGLSDDQEFEEMEIYLSETIPSSTADATAPTFEIVNSSSGINTAYRDAEYKIVQDQLYRYEIKNVFVRTYDEAGNDTKNLTASVTTGSISGGEQLQVALTGNRIEGQLVEIEVNYMVYGETGESFKANGKDIILSKTVYTYVGASNLDDDAVAVKTAQDAPYIEYYPSIYLDQGDDLDDIEGYSIRIKDKDDEAAATATVNSVNVPEFLTKNAVAEETTVSMDGKSGLFFLYPFDVNTKADGEYYERFEEIYAVDEEGNIILDDETGEPIIDPDTPDNGGIVNGQYNVTTSVTAYGQNYTIPTTIHLYDDFGLVSMFERAVAANRQTSDYRDGYEGTWNNYTAALKNAARLALKPKTGSSFAADIAIDPSTGYANKYEKAAEDLENAIEALSAFEANSGTAGLKSALANFSGINYKTVTDENGYPTRVDIEYDNPAYTYFGMRDYVPHTYNKYRDARDRVEDLIESQQAFVIGFDEDYELTDDDKAAYAESVLAYEEAIANMGVISSIEATYAIHKLNLIGGRLIRLSGDTSKLELLVDKYGDAMDSRVSYTESSKDRYERAVTFAIDVLCEDDPRPSKINQATSELVAAWKRLAESASYVALNEAIANADAVIRVTGTDANRQKDYTADSYQAFLDAYDAAKNAEKDLSATEENNKYLAGLTSDLTKAQANLAPVVSGEVVIEFITEPNGMFIDGGFNAEFTPQISQAVCSHEFYMQMLEDGTEVDGYLVGVGEGVPDEDTLLTAFAALENVDVVITPDAETEAYGTGTLVQFFNAGSGALEKTFIVVVLGDVDRDSVVSGNDVAALRGNIGGKTDWEWDGCEQYLAAAADIGNDGAPDVTDIPFLRGAYVGNGYINQEPSSEEGVPSYVLL